MDYLFPRVYDWVITNALPDKTQSIFQKSFKKVISRNSAPNFRPLNDIVWSCTEVKNRNLGLRVTNKKEAISLTSTLQSHFHVYMSDAPIRTEYLQAIVKVCLHIISTRPEYNDHYFRSNLHLRGSDLYSEIVELEKRLNDGNKTSFSIDLALRSLNALIEDISDLGEDDFIQLSEILRPIWDRYIEDLICKSYY